MYATYLGGLGNDIGEAIAVDTAGAAHVAGSTEGFGLPTVNPLQTRFGGRVDAFVAKLAPDGAALVHSTFLGGRSNDFGRGIAVDLAGATYVIGLTRSDDFPTMQPLQATGGINLDAFIAKLTDDSLASPSGNGNVSDGQDSRDGGGSIDALLAALLAQLALARALRQRVRPGE